MTAIERGGGAGHLKAILGLGAVAERTDAELLDRFAARRDEGSELAFGVLVARHGPMVLRTCRAVLRDAHEAEDAFQATFLVLARRRPRAGSSLAPWLHEVAHRTALCARSAAFRRRRHEGSAARDPARPAADDRPDELAGLVDEEVRRLPERYRPAVVLCLLEGRTPEQAARALGCPVGTVHSRLARGRERLRAQLARRGVAAPSVAVLGSVAVPSGLIWEAKSAAARVAAGGPMVAGAGSIRVAALSEGVLSMMSLVKLKSGLLAGSLVLLGLAAAGAGGVRAVLAWNRAELASPEVMPAPQPEAARGDVVAVEPGGSIQAAIDAAPAGGTVRVAAGAFAERIVIRKPLTLEGAG